MSLRMRLRGQRTHSTKSALLVVYAGYAARYLSLIILIPYYGRVLGPADYGKVLTGMSLMSVIWLLVNYGFSQVGTRDIAGTTDHGVLALQLGRHLRARGLLLAVGVAVGGIATWASPVLHAEPIYGILATVIGVLSGLNLGWYFQGTRQYTTSIALEAAGFALTVVLVLLMVKTAADAPYALLSLVIVNVITLTAAYTIALKQLGGKPLGIAGQKLSAAFKLIHDSTPLFLLSVAPMITMSATSYLLSLVASSRDVGHFGSAERLTTAILGLFGPATQVMLSTMSARVNSGHDEIGNYALMRKAMFGLTGFGLLAALVTIVAAPYIVPLIFGKDFEESVPIVQLLAIGFPFAALVQAAATFVLMPMRKERVAVVVTITVAVIQIVALMLLASEHGSTGAATARFACDILSAVLLVGAMWRIGVMQRVLHPSRVP